MLNGESGTAILVSLLNNHSKNFLVCSSLCLEVEIPIKEEPPIQKVFLFKLFLSNLVSCVFHKTSSAEAKLFFALLMSCWVTSPSVLLNVLIVKGDTTDW
ncbi:Uncharacterised protein, partial [Mycoplasmoides gallisepticum]